MKLKVNTEIEVEDDSYCSPDCQYIKVTMNYCRLFHSALLHVYFNENSNNEYSKIVRCDCCKQIIENKE